MNQDLLKPPVEEIVIESDVPVAGTGYGACIKENAYYKALNRLEVGQSFAYPKLQTSTIQYAIMELKKHGGVQFTTRKTSESHRRVWRTA